MYNFYWDAIGRRVRQINYCNKTPSSWYFVFLILSCGLYINPNMFESLLKTFELLTILV